MIRIALMCVLLAMILVASGCTVIVAAGEGRVLVAIANRPAPAMELDEPGEPGPAPPPVKPPSP